MVCPGHCRSFNVDFTIRCPWADRTCNVWRGYRGMRTGHEAEVCLQEAQKEKEKAYSKDVIALAYSPQGRPLKSGAERLQQLANAVAAVKGIGTSGDRLYHRWRARLERTLLWAEADNVLLCWGRGTSSKAREAQRRDAAA